MDFLIFNKHFKNHSYVKTTKDSQHDAVLVGNIYRTSFRSFRTGS